MTFEPTNYVRAWPKPVQLVALHGARQAMVRDETGIAFIVQLSHLLPLIPRDVNFASLFGASSLSGFTRASSKLAWNGQTYVTYANNEPAWAVGRGTGLRGLLREPEATNFMPNNSMTGAVAGTPGTLPNTWDATSPGGLSRQVVGIGTHLGIPYIDLRLFGTANATSFFYGLGGNTESGVAAVGERWTASACIEATGGTLPGQLLEITVNERNSTGTNITQRRSGFIQPWQKFDDRVVFSIELLNAGVSRLSFGLRGVLVIGQEYDFTLRLGGFQLEKTPYASSIILTSGGPATRAADVLSISGALPAIYSAYVSYQPFRSLANAAMVSFNDGTSDNAVTVGHTSAGRKRVDVTVGGVASSEVVGNARGFSHVIHRQTVSVGAGARIVYFDDDKDGVTLASSAPPATQIDVGVGEAAGIIERITVYTGAPAGVAATPGSRELNVFLVGGQSNANGFMTVAQEYINTVGLVSDWVKGWNKSELRAFGVSTGGPNSDGLSIISGVATGWGAYGLLALHIIARELPGVTACWATNGGTKLGVGGAWHTLADGTPVGELAVELKLRYDTLAQYCRDNGITIRPRAIFWMQGEADNSEVDRNAYRANFEAFIRSVRGYTGNATLPIIYGTTTAAGPAEVRAAHLGVAQDDPHAWVRDNLDLVDVGDGIHFEEESLGVLAKWTADTFLENYT